MLELSDKANALIDLCRDGGRFCPKPTYWRDLWQLLPDRKSKPSGGWSPPSPLILAAWWEASNIEKALRLRAHIVWADEHGAIDVVDTYLRGLTEEQWFHGNDG